MNLPQFEKSLGAYPGIVTHWGSKNRRKPFQIAHKSNLNIYLKCTKDRNHPEWESRASDLTRKDKQRAKLNCPECKIKAKK